jgi:hypothetical protein
MQAKVARRSAKREGGPHQQVKRFGWQAKISEEI